MVWFYADIGMSRNAEVLRKGEWGLQRWFCDQVKVALGDENRLK